LGGKIEIPRVLKFNGVKTLL